MQNINIKTFQDFTGIQFDRPTPPKQRGRSSRLFTEQDRKLIISNLHTKRKCIAWTLIVSLKFTSSVRPGLLLSKSILVLNNNKLQGSSTTYPVSLPADLIQRITVR